MIAQSVGAVLVSTWLHDYAPKIRCAVLASPAFKIMTTTLCEIHGAVDEVDSSFSGILEDYTQRLE